MLFRSDPTSVVGVWKHLELPTGFPTIDFAKGRLHAVGSDVFVFARNGEAVQLTFTNCTP